jgi:hypothetical protein
VVSEYFVNPYTGHEKKRKISNFMP